MSKGSITLSKKHGVGPVKMQCFYCGEGDSIALLGTRADKLEREFGHLPSKVVFDKEPCAKCQDYMKQGIILIGSNNEEGTDRTGHFFVVTEECVQRLFGEAAQTAIDKRACFVDPEVCAVFEQGIDKALKREETE